MRIIKKFDQDFVILHYFRNVRRLKKLLVASAFALTVITSTWAEQTYYTCTYNPPTCCDIPITVVDEKACGGRGGIGCDQYLEQYPQDRSRICAEVREKGGGKVCPDLTAVCGPDCNQARMAAARAEAKHKEEVGRDLVEDAFEYTDELIHEASEALREEVKHYLGIDIGAHVGIDVGLHVTKKRFPKKLVLAEMASPWIAVLETLELLRKEIIIIRNFNDGAKESSRMLRAGLDLLEEAVDIEIAELQRFLECSEARERAAALKDLKQEAHELINEWMLPGGRYYEAPQTGELLNSEAALKRALEILSEKSTAYRPRKWVNRKIVFVGYEDPEKEAAITDEQVVQALAEIDQAIELYVRGTDRLILWFKLRREARSRLEGIAARFRSLYGG
jgi:hypothetical protein